MTGVMVSTMPMIEFEETSGAESCAFGLSARQFYRGSNLQSATRADAVCFCGGMASLIVFGRLPLRCHETAIFRVYRSVMGQL